LRNQPKPLSPADDARVESLIDYLRSRPERSTIVLHYVKRDGTSSRSVGLLGDFSGRPHHDTASVTILTADKGPRTINLVGVTGADSITND
jgi:hypothetical protein